MSVWKKKQQLNPIQSFENKRDRHFFIITMKVKTLKYITCSIARSSVQTENSPYPKGGYVQFRGWIVIRDGIRAYRHRLRRAFQPRRPQSRHRQSPYQHACGWGYMRSRGIRSVIVSSWAEGDVMTSLWSQWVNGEHSPRVYLDSRKWFASTGSCDVIFVRLAKPGVHDYRTECGTWWRCLQFVSTVAGQEPAKRLHSHIFITHRHQRWEPHL